MKFPSLFTKVPSYKRFAYEPRYYDAKAEELKEREERIRREIARERGEDAPEGDAGYRGRIAGSFQSARRRSKKSPGELNSTMLRLGVLLFLSLFLIAFFTWGNVVVYSLFVVVPVYFYLKFKNSAKG